MTHKYQHVAVKADLTSEPSRPLSAICQCSDLPHHQRKNRHGNEQRTTQEGPEHGRHGRHGRVESTGGTEVCSHNSWHGSKINTIYIYTGYEMI